MQFDEPRAYFFANICNITRKSETFSSHFNPLQSTQVNRCSLSIHTEDFWFFDVFREYRKREKWVMGLVMDMFALVCRKPLSRNEKYVYHNYSFMLNAFRNLSNIFTMRLKKTHHYYFCVTINNMYLRFHTTGLFRYHPFRGYRKEPVACCISPYHSKTTNHW